MYLCDGATSACLKHDGNKRFYGIAYRLTNEICKYIWVFLDNFSWCI